jgi:hypothetical protein
MTKRLAQQRRCRYGMTLVEMLVAMTLTLMLMGAVAQIFGMFGKGLNGSRSVTELYERMRATGHRLRQDLNGVTVDTTVVPPVLASRNNGYFEYIEGPETDRITFFGGAPFNKANGAVSGGTWTGSPEPYLSQVGSDDRLVGDIDDVLLFTTRSGGEPFSGRVDSRNGNLEGGSIRSPYAEVAWFCRPTPNTLNPRTYTLYRRQRLVMAHPGAEPFVNTTAGGPATNTYGGPPNTLPFTNWTDIYAKTDVSCRRQGAVVVPNCLGDLTRRENRFLHAQLFPFVFPHPLYAYDPANHTFENTPARFGEDVILTNVLAFDVRIWDPDAVIQGVPGMIATGGAAGGSRLAVEPGDNGYIAPGDSAFPATGTPGYGSTGVYVDLAWNNAPGVAAVGVPFPPAGTTPFQGLGSRVSSAPRNDTLPYPTYDTWTDFYESNGVDDNANGIIDDGTNGLDDNNNGVIDEAIEQETSPPYPAALQHSSGSSSGTGGIQVRIRCYEPASQQVRQITILQQL